MPAQLPDWIAEVLGPIRSVDAVFDRQDSGCVSFGLTLDKRRVFVKTATESRGIDALSRAAWLHAKVRHKAIVPMLQALRSGQGSALVFPWIRGEHLYPAGSSAHDRFRRLPLDEVLRALDSVFDAHLALAAAGYISVDFYDGSLLYDFGKGRIHLIDLDEFHQGPTTVQGERQLGSTRFMAPEEWVHGAVIDQRTTVFHLASTACVFLDPRVQSGGWRASEPLREVAHTGRSPEPERRFPDVASFVEAWGHARRTSPA